MNSTRANRHIDKQTDRHNGHKTVGTTDTETLIHTVAHLLPGTFENIYTYIINIYKQILIDTFAHIFTDKLASRQLKAQRHPYTQLQT